MLQQIRGKFAIVSEGSLGKVGRHQYVPPLTPTKAALILEEHLPCLKVMPKVVLHGREARVRDKEATKRELR